MEKDQERVNQLEREKAALESQIALQESTLNNQLQQLRLKITNDLKPKADRISEVEELFNQASQEDDNLSTEADAIRQDRERAEELDSRIRFINQDNTNLRESMNDTRKKFDMLEQGDAACPLCGEPLDEAGKQRLRAEYEAQGLEQKNRFNANLAELESLSADHKQLATSIPRREAELEKKRETIRVTMLGLKRDAEESRNAFAELKNVSVQFEKLIAAITNDDYAPEERRRIVEINQELKDIGFSVEARRSMQELVRKLNGEITELDADLNTKRQNTQGKVALLERELLDSTKARDELEPAMAELEGITTQLRGNNFAREERQKLAELNVKLAAIGYDPAQHRQTRDKVKSLERYDDMHRKLMEANEYLPPAYEEMESASQMLRRRQAEIKDGVARMAKLEEELKTLPTLEAQLKEQETALAGLEGQRSKALIEQGRINQQITRCDTLKAEISADEKRRHDLVEEKGIYDELAMAFGKNGIQTLIIEAAIPQIEDDANELLGRLTDNRMFLRFDLKEGRRDARTKQPTEELDIRIADEIGTRSYETFSGGEAFRINFAIRIALSKLLARRSGAPLPILFIDEGFGSQDSAGQERLTEAIQSIQDDFQKIIVITHIDQIKEAFPVRIEVVKTDLGSEFTIV
jgi:exonuclease SbcC